MLIFQRSPWSKQHILVQVWTVLCTPHFSNRRRLQTPALFGKYQTFTSCTAPPWPSSSSYDMYYNWKSCDIIVPTHLQQPPYIYKEIASSPQCKTRNKIPNTWVETSFHRICSWPSRFNLHIHLTSTVTERWGCKRQIDASTPSCSAVNLHQTAPVHTQMILSDPCWPIFFYFLLS